MPTTDQRSKDKEESRFGFILANIAQSIISSIPAALSAVEIIFSILAITNPIVLVAVGLGVFIASTRLMYLINQPDPMLEARLTGLRKQEKDIETGGSYQPRTLEEIQQMFPALIAEKKDTWFSRARRNNAFALSSTLVGLSTTIAIISLGGTPLPFIAAVAVVAPWTIPVAATVILVTSLAIQWWKLEKTRVAMEAEVATMRMTKREDIHRDTMRNKGRETLASKITHAEQIQPIIDATQTEATIFLAKKPKKDTGVKRIAGFVSLILGLVTGASIYAVIHAYVLPNIITALAATPVGWIAVGIGAAAIMAGGIAYLSYQSFNQSFKEDEKYAAKIIHRAGKLADDETPKAEAPNALPTHSFSSFIKNPKILQPALILVAGIAALVATAIVGIGLPLVLVSAGVAAVVAAGTAYIGHYSKEQRVLAEKLKCANELKEAIKPSCVSLDSSISSQGTGEEDPPALSSSSSSSSSRAPTPTPAPAQPPAPAPAPTAIAFFATPPGDTADDAEDETDGKPEGETGAGETLPPPN